MNSVKNTFLSYVNSISIQIFVLAGMVILTRILEPLDFGIWAVVAATQALMQPFFTMGLGPAFIKREEVNNFHRNAFYTLNIAISIGIALVFLVMGIVFSKLFDNPIYVPIGVLQSISAILYGFTMQRFDSLYRNKNMFAILKINLSSTVFSLLTGIGFALAGFGVWSLAIKLLSNNLMQFIMAKLVYPFNYKLLSINKLNVIRDDIQFGLKLTIGRFLNGISGSIDKYVISGIASTETLGQYDRSFMMNNRVYQTSYMPINMIILPYISRVGKEKLSATYNFLFFCILIISILPCLLFAINANSLILLLFGIKWEQASYFAPLLSFWLISKIFMGFTEMVLTNEYKAGVIITQKSIYILLIVIGSGIFYFNYPDVELFILTFSIFSLIYWIIIFVIRTILFGNNVHYTFVLVIKLSAIFLSTYIFHLQFDAWNVSTDLVYSILLKSVYYLLYVIPFVLLIFKKDVIRLNGFLKTRIKYKIW